MKRADIATLRGDMDKVDAAMSVFITLEEPTKPMIQEAKAAGQYQHEEMGRSYDKINIVTIREIVEGRIRLEIPMSMDVLKAAKKAIKKEQSSLAELFEDQ